MKIDLTSRATVLYKIIFPSIWTFSLILITIIIFIDSKDLNTFFVLVMLLPILILVRIRKISYDDERIYVSDWLRLTSYNFGAIKSIKGGDLTSLNPFFTIEVIGATGKVRRIAFMPKISEQFNFWTKNEFSGRLLAFKKKVQRSHSVI